MSKIWRVTPLPNAVLDYLRKNKSCSDEDIMRALRKDDDNMNIEILNKTLLKLEVQGLIRVSTASKNRKKIELI